MEAMKLQCLRKHLELQLLRHQRQEHPGLELRLEHLRQLLRRLLKRLKTLEKLLTKMILHMKK